MIDTQRQEETSDVTKESKNQAMNEVKTVENINKNRQKTQGTSDVQKEGPPSHKLQSHKNE